MARLGEKRETLQIHSGWVTFFVADVVLLLAVIAVWWFAPSRHAFARMGAAVVIVLLVALTFSSAWAIVKRNVWAWRAALCTAALVLLIECLLLFALLAGAAYLSGIYGSFGKAAAGISLAATLLTVCLLGILPALQMQFLLRRKPMA